MPSIPDLIVPRFVPKPTTRTHAGQPWVVFGSTKELYDYWIPHVCGICCLKMVGDTLGKTSSYTLYALTMMCLERGGFGRLTEE